MKPPCCLNKFDDSLPIACMDAYGSVQCRNLQPCGCSSFFQPENEANHPRSSLRA